MILWVWMFTMSVEGAYYGCRDANDVHVFHGFIKWEHNPQDSSQWVSSQDNCHGPFLPR